MKTIVNVSRAIVGCLFIFSGLVKANDPLGLAYKMQEFFEVWAVSGFFKGLMLQLHENALPFSVFIIALEIILGLALLLAWKPKITSWLLFLLTIFFTFLTAYVLFSGKIKACGCFGDCIPLTPEQTFTKDIILLVLVLVILFNQKYLTPVFKPLVTNLLMLAGLLFAIFIQVYCLRNLPIMDCLPYKKGNDIKANMQVPKDAVMPKYDYNFTYEKAGQRKSFSMNELPDSTWKFVDRQQVLVQEGKNYLPAISDFALSGTDGKDVTDSILSLKGKYFLLLVKELPENREKWIGELKAFASKLPSPEKLILVSGQPLQVMDYLKSNNIKIGAGYSCDATAIKTAARANPTMLVMNGSIIEDKISWSGFQKLKP